jgi:hypothetical protein
MPGNYAPRFFRQTTRFRDFAALQFSSDRFCVPASRS